MTIYFLIPTYNESDNVELLARNLNSILPDFNKYYVFVDDCSTDNTVDKLKQLFNPNSISIIEKKKNVGPGNSFNMGFEWILNQSSNVLDDIVVTIEADNTSDLSILPIMITLSQLDYSLVLASVYAQGGGFDKTSFFRKLISFFANMIFRLIFDIKVLTLSSFYRVYRLSLLKKIKEKNGTIITENGFICMLEILLKSIKVNAKIIEVPMMLYSANRKGKSKMKVWKTFKSYFKMMLKYYFKKSKFNRIS